MSSKAKKFEEASELMKKTEELMMKTTLIGTIIMSIGILNGRSKEDMKALFKSMRENSSILPNTAEGLCEYVWRELGSDDNIKAKSSLVLITDKEEIRTPMVSFVINECLMPVDENGLAWGVLGLAREGRDTVDIEYIYNEDGELYGDNDSTEAVHA